MHNKRWSNAVRFVVAAHVLVYGLLVVGAAQQQVPLPGPVGGTLLPIEVLGTSATDEGSERQWVAVLSERYIETSAAGYRPHVTMGAGASTPIPVKYEQANEFRWEFGDGTGVISTGERPSISHAFADDGDFTLRVEAWSKGRVFAAGEKVVKVRNRGPRLPVIAAVEVDPATSTFEFTAHATDVDDDPLSYEWDFDDGGPPVAGEWRVQHAFRTPGRHTVKVTFKDDEGETRDSTRRIVVASAESANGNTIGPLDARPTGAAQTSISIHVAGGADFTFAGEIRPVAGIYLGPREPNNGCRFMFTAWDNANLAHLAFILDLERLVPEGAIYTYKIPAVWLNLEENAKAYELKRGVMSGSAALGPRGIGELLLALPGVGDMDEAQRRALGNQVGVEPGTGERGVPVPTAARSPFGLDDHEGFKSASGELVLRFIPYDRATGRLDATLRSTRAKDPFPSVTLNGDFVLDLAAARRDGLMIYDRCDPADLRIERVAPEDGETFVMTARPSVAANLSGEYAPETLDSSTFQLTYPEVGSGDPVPVDVKVFRGEKSASIRPEQDLLGGVRYTARIKVGEDGVRDRAGHPIPDESGTGWYTWSFTTKLDFVPDDTSAGGADTLACHVFQTVRDAPLIVDKPAAARIYANWRKHPQVHPDAQVKTFTAHLSLLDGEREIVTDFFTFVRPDLWQSEGIRQAKAEHTANLFFTPTARLPASLRVKLALPSDIGDSVPPTHWASCSTPTWSLAPTIKVQWYLLNVNRWNDIDVETDVKPWATTIMNEARTLAQQLFPLKSVQMEYGGMMRYPPSYPDRDAGAHLNCDLACANGVMQYWQESPVFSAIGGLDYDASATMMVVIMPTRAEDPAAKVSSITGGVTRQRAGVSGPARIVFAMEENPQYKERFVSGVVHEMGHALWLEHLPWLEPEWSYAQKETGRVRDEAWANGSAFWYAGIEGFRIALDGRSGMNKSSVEGNAENTWLVPLMYPSTMYIKDVFIARHHYLEMMRTFESRPGVSTP